MPIQTYLAALSANLAESPVFKSIIVNISVRSVKFRLLLSGENITFYTKAAGRPRCEYPAMRKVRASGKQNTG